MAITHGFFNSVNDDRLYNADTFNTYFEGLISANGVFDNVGGGFVVSTGDGMTVNVAPGKALVNSCWVKSDAIETLAIDAAHSLLPRYDIVYLEWNAITRLIALKYKAGTAASSPTKEAPTRNGNTYQIYLAYIYVAAGATAITAANIEDCRHDTDVCGIVRGLVEQIDTGTIYDQYLSQFNDLMATMEAWEASQQAAYNSWFTTLTGDLVVNTHLEEYKESTTTTEPTATYTITTEQYTDGDILDVFLNNIILLNGVDYTINNNVITFTNAIRANNIITVRIIKSVIGNVATTKGALTAQSTATTHINNNGFTTEVTNNA